jgi:hypothetical protein
MKSILTASSVSLFQSAVSMVHQEPVPLCQKFGIFLTHGHWRGFIWQYRSSWISCCEDLKSCEVFLILRLLKLSKLWHRVANFLLTMFCHTHPIWYTVLLPLTELCVLDLINVLQVRNKTCWVVEYITTNSMFIFLKISGILNLTLSYPMLDFVWHYDFPVPDAFPHVVWTLAKR